MESNPHSKGRNAIHTLKSLMDTIKKSKTSVVTDVTTNPTETKLESLKTTENETNGVIIPSNTDNENFPLSKEIINSSLFFETSSTENDPTKKPEFSYMDGEILQKDVCAFMELDDNKNKSFTIHMCIYTINKESLYPYVKYAFIKSSDTGKMTFPSVTNFLSNNLGADNETDVNQQFRDICSVELSKYTSIHSSFKEGTLDTILKGFYQDGDNLFVFFDSTIIISPNETLKETEEDTEWGIIDEIIHLEHIREIPIDETIVKMFVEHPDFTYIYNQDGFIIDRPKVLYHCSLSLSDEKLINTIDDGKYYHYDRVFYSPFGYMFYFSQKPLLDDASVTETLPIVEPPKEEPNAVTTENPSEAETEGPNETETKGPKKEENTFFNRFGGGSEATNVEEKRVVINIEDPNVEININKNTPSSTSVTQSSVESTSILQTNVIEQSSNKSKRFAVFIENPLYIIQPLTEEVKQKIKQYNKKEDDEYNYVDYYYSFYFQDVNYGVLWGIRKKSNITEI